MAMLLEVSPDSQNHPTLNATRPSRQKPSSARVAPAESQSTTIGSVSTSSRGSWASAASSTQMWSRASLAPALPGAAGRASGVPPPARSGVSR
jgi:hypothetical protein